jgi:type I restriction enzyme S subunit
MSEVKILPKGWKIKKLGEVCHILAGYGFPKDLQGLSSGQFPFYKVGDISKNVKAGHRYLELCDNYIDEKTLLQLKAKPYPQNTVVFAKIGESLKLNRRAIINVPGIVDNNAIGLKANEKICNDLFLYNFLTTVKLEDYSKATTVPSVRKSEIEDIAFILPPLSAQTAIVSKIEELFSELDKGIENLRTAQQQLRIYRQSVLKSAFEGRLTNGGSVPQKGTESAPDGSNPLPTRELPQGWKWVNLKDICKIIGGVTKGKDFKGKATILLPYLRVANVQDGYLNLKEIKTIEVLPEDEQKYALEYGDILYTEGGDKDKLGRGTIWINEVARCIHQNHIFRARPLSKDNISKFIAYYSQTRFAKDYFYKHGKQTTNLASINLTILSNLPIPFCSPIEQQQIVQEIERRLTVADKMDKSIRNSLLQAEALRQSILKMAFEGRLVSEASAAMEKPKPKPISPPSLKEAKPKSKPKNDHWYKVQIMGYILHYSKTKGIEHGEMTLAKYTYLIDKIYDVKTGYEFERGHLGPYSIEMKKIVNDKKFFDHVDNHLELKDSKTIFKYSNAEETKVQKGIKDLCEIFGTYPVNRKAHKIELLATVCKVLEDIKSTDFAKVRKSMKEWKINLTTTHFKNKAEKFTEAETKKCIEFIIQKGWEKKLIEAGA